MGPLDIVSVLIGQLLVLTQPVTAPHEMLVGKSAVLFCNGDHGYHKQIQNVVMLTEAKTTCEDTLGGYVVHLETVSEQLWLSQRFMAVGTSVYQYWIGLERGQENISDWFWVTGTSSVLATNLTNRWDTSPTYDTAVASTGFIKSYSNYSTADFVCETEGAPFDGYCFDNATVTFYRSHGSNIYNYISYMTDFDSAREFCEAIPNTHLVNLETNDENNWLNTMLGELSPNSVFWIGLRKTSEGGEWQWLYQNNVTQSINESSFDSMSYPTAYLHAYTEYSLWKTSDRTTSRNFICETEIQNTFETTSATAITTSSPTNSSNLTSTQDLSTISPSTSTSFTLAMTVPISSTILPANSSDSTSVTPTPGSTTISPANSPNFTSSIDTLYSSTISPASSSDSTSTTSMSGSSTFVSSASLETIAPSPSSTTVSMSTIGPSQATTQETIIVNTAPSDGVIYTMLNSDSSCDLGCRSLIRHWNTTVIRQTHDIVMTSSVLKCARLCLNVQGCIEIRYVESTGICFLFI